MPCRNKNFIILPKSWSGHGRTDRTGSAGPVRCLESMYYRRIDMHLKACTKRQTRTELNYQFSSVQFSSQSVVSDFSPVAPTSAQFCSVALYTPLDMLVALW